MRRTLREVLNLIKEQKNNAEIDLEKSFATNKVFPYPEKIYNLQGEIAAYNSVITLIETSHLLEDSNEDKEHTN